MWQFDSLKIQRNIEEKRLIFGQKFENFLLRNLRNFVQKTDKFLCSKNFCIWSVSVIFLLSVYLRSLLDIGSDSGIYVDISNKILSGAKYYYDFVEPNLPLSFWLYAIPNYAAKFFNISPILAAEIFVNLLGILSIIFSALILGKSTLQRVHQNLLITSFAIGFFLRIYALETGEFLTKTSFLLCFTYPYIAFSFSRKAALSKKEMLTRGLLAGLIPCLKPHYIFIPLAIELHRFWQKKSLKFFVELDKLIMCLVGVFYIVLMIKFTPELFEFAMPMCLGFYASYDSGNFFLMQFLNHSSERVVFFGGVFLIFLRQKFSKDDKILSLVFIAASLILISENLGSIDQRACFFSLIIPVFVKIFYDFLKSEKFNFREGGMIYSFFLMLAIVDPKSFNTLAKISIFWWVIIPILSVNLFKKLQSDNFRIDSIFAKKTNQIIWLLFFLALIASSVFVALKNQEAYMLLSVLIILIFLFFYEKTYKRFYKSFSQFFVFTQLFLAATLIALIFSSISEAYKGDDPVKTPNALTDKIAQYTKLYSPSGGNISVLSDFNFYYSPITLHLVGADSYITYSMGVLFSNDRWMASYKAATDKSSRAFVINYFLNYLKSQLNDKNMQVVFINNDSYRILNGDDRCRVGFLERYFDDLEFRNIFLKNYKFVGRIFATEVIKSDNQTSFFAQKGDEFDKLELSRSRTVYDFEVYARKNN